ncbi:MAG: hypothetical protein JSS20_18965 [Proteobacteria bacterium]|nr:hypothetical protein [Pseudomonadota bacterium]
MGGISDDQVEWAVVHRLKAMLDAPPKTEFNVTQTFAHFNAILLWTKNRARIGDRKPRIGDPGAQLRDRLNNTTIYEEPWLLSRAHPDFPKAPENEYRPEIGPINSDFEGKSAAAFLKWLRDALAHGDGRSILPLHKPSVRYDKTLLAGFKVVFNEVRGADRILTLHLYHQDMLRIGKALADDFCRELGRPDDEQNAALVLEAAE